MRVLLLEAGGSDWHPRSAFRSGVGHIRQRNLFDWGYASEPQKNLNGRRIELKRGKVIGGSSSINFMAHNRGNRSDYDRWVRMGHADWSYEHLLPYFRRLEKWRDEAPPHRGQGGPVGVTYTCRNDPLASAVLDAALQAGLPALRRPQWSGARWLRPCAIRHGWRATGQRGASLSAAGARAAATWFSAPARWSRASCSKGAPPSACITTRRGP